MSEAPPSPSSTAENASASVVGELESDVMVIVSSTLSEFFQHNTPDTATIATSAKILQTLLQNAMRKDEPHRKIRLGNPKIQRNVVHVRGALDILGLAGFVTVEQMEGDTTSLFLIMPDPHRDPTQQQQQQQQQALVHAICDGLQVKLQELLESSSSSCTAAPQHLLTDKNTHKKQKTTAGTIRTVDRSNNGPFLSEEERRLRQVKATAMKKAKKEAQKIALQKWEEDKQDRKQAAERREALLQANTIDAVGIKIQKETRKATSLPLAKSMATAVDLDQQKEALAALARARYEQMKALSPPIKNLPIKQPDTEKDTTHMHTDAAMDDLEEDQKLPATNSIVSPPAPSLLPQDSINVDTNGMTTQWKQFVQHNPRCASAEGIRDSSCYSRSGGGAAGANPDLSIPTCLKHLFKELDGLKDSLPTDSNASIWLRFDEETPQYIRVMMAAPLPGPTPYSGGAFLFDIYIPGNYPHVPPKVTLLTTGGGKVRFGPNLYADGKVCLSLLGTWSGPKWNPSHSSLYQVLISIQGLILGIEHPYYLEPGHGGWEGNVKEGDFQLTGHTLKGEQVKEEVGVPIKVVLYEDALRVGTVKYAMLDPLAVALLTTNLSSVQNKSGSSSNILWQPFRSILQAHFAMNRAEIMTEVRKWMSDQALGRNRSSISHTTLTIDQLNALMPKLETRLSNVSIPERDNSIDTNATPARGLNTDTQIGIDMNTKPAAKPASATSLEVIAEKRAYDASRDNCMVTETTQVKDNSGKVDIVEEKRQIMQAAASNGDYILAGQLQEEVKRLEDLKRSMEEAAKQGDFIRAGRLQAQFKALTSHEKSANIKTAPAKSKLHQAVDEDMMDEDEFDSSDDDEDDDDDMSTEGAGIFGNTAGGLPTVPHGLGKYVHSSGMGLRHHTWGSGSKLAAAPTPATSTSSKVTNETPTVAKRIIPLKQLCRLRLRLPHAGNKSVVEDFDKTEPLSAVYRRLEDLVPGASGQKGSGNIAPRVAGSGAFAQPLSSAGFTLLLTRPKREFGLEMHGTKSLADLNLAPSATLTVMKCSDRGVMFQGELESRLRQAQGDAIDVEGLTYEGLVELTERLGTAAPADGMPFVALSRKELEENSETFSPFTYLTELNSCKGKTDEDELRCPICLGDYDSTDSNKSLRKLTNCNHMFHTGCLETWLGTKSSCPLCKMSVCPTPSNLA